MKINKDLNIKHIIALFSYHRSVRVLMQSYRGIDPDIGIDGENREIAPTIIYLFKHCLELIGKILLVTPTSNRHSLQTFIKYIISENAEVAFEGDEVTFDFSESEQEKLRNYCEKMFRGNSKYPEGSVAWLKMMIYLEDSFKISLRQLFHILRKYDFGDTQNSYYRYLDVKITKPMGDFNSYVSIVEEMNNDFDFLDDCVHLITFLFLSKISDKP